MPLAIKDCAPDDGVKHIEDGGKYYTDALVEPDFWQAFTKLLQDNNGKNENEKSEENGSFSNAKVSHRIVVVATGAIVNIIFAIIVFFFLSVFCFFNKLFKNFRMPCCDIITFH